MVDVKLTAKGNRFFRLRVPGVPLSAPPLSQHTGVESAYEAAVKHAAANNIDGIYTVQPPDGWEIETMGFGVVSSPPPASAGQIWLQSAPVSVSEFRTLQFTVHRGAGSAGAVAVDWSFAVSQGSPSPASGTVNFANGDTATKTVSVALQSVASTISGTVTLSNPRSTSGGPVPALGTAQLSVTVTNDTTAPSTPVLGTPSVLSSSSMSVPLQTPSTDNESGFLRYTLQRSTNVEFTLNVSNEAQGDASIFPRIATGLSGGTTYFWRVIAEDRAGNTITSSVVGATTQSAGGASMNLILEASTLSGVAPLPVLLDATKTTSTSGIDPFHQGGYGFALGGISGTHAHSGLSKNIQRGGPLAVGVFETPGTHVVKCRVRDSSGGSNDGDTDQKQLTINVADPNTFYGGASTICLSRTSDFTGAPAGATLVPNVTSWPARQSRRRYLMHAGQDFTPLGDLLIDNVELSQFGRFGSGANPSITSVQIERSFVFGGTHVVWSNRNVFMDLRMTGAPQGIRSNNHNLFLRCSTNGNIFFTRDGWESHAFLEWPHHLYFVECTMVGGSYGFIGSGGMHCFVGCDIRTATVADGHNIRSGCNYKGVYSHNLFHDNLSPGRHYLKLHSHGYDAYPENTHLRAGALNPLTKYCVIANNVLGPQSPDVIAWALAVSPQADGAPEPIEDIIVEGCRATRNFSLALARGGRRITQRGNTSAVGSFNVGDNSHTPPAGHAGPYPNSANAIQVSDPI